jgi:phosphate transport system substrate-binding protein
MRAAALVLSCTLTLAAAAEKPQVDPGIPTYQATQGLAGTLTSIGSDTLNNLMAYWAEGFRKAHPTVVIGIEGKGSSTAPPALIQGTAQLGPMSREMNATEIDQFEKRHGVKPLAIRVAVDALGVFVHKDNPMEAITLTQLDSLFGAVRKRGGPDVQFWSELGVAGRDGRPVSLYGRNSASGTYGYFKEHALKKGDFKATVKEQPGSSAVVQGIAADADGIGYSGIGYLTAGVKALRIGETTDTVVEPSYAHCLDGSYPLARFLVVYVHKPAGKPLPPITQAFIAYMLSQEGQATVVKDGYYPVPLDTVTEDLAAIR